MWIQTGDTEPIVVLVLDSTGVPLTDNANIKVKVRRRSDGKYLDWDDNSFKYPASVIELLVDMEEVSKDYSPGEYRLNQPAKGHSRGFNTSSIVSPVADDVYFFTAVEDNVMAESVNMPQVGQLRTGGALDEVIDKTPVIF